jgi:very-short-patch-repair endonuclease
VGRSKNPKDFSGGGPAVKASRDAIVRARELRVGATDHERRLWSRLRELKKVGYHFRRQVPLKSYFLDFVEHGAKLVVELDGSQHGMAQQLHKDERRDATLREEGYCVLRFWNYELNENMDGVMETIVRRLRERRPPPEARAALRPPHKGEVD